MLSVQLLVLLVAVTTASAAQFSLRYNYATQQYKVSNDPSDGEVVCNAEYNASFETQGWDVLTVEPTRPYLRRYPFAAYYAAGFLEGYLTPTRIYNNYLNTIKPVNDSLSPKALKWIEEHYKFLDSFEKVIPERCPTPSGSR